MLKVVDLDKINKIGIDRIVLNNFTIENLENLQIKEIISDSEYSEKLTKNTELFKLTYSNILKSTGEIYTSSTLEFNPNKITYSHNIYNSTVEDLKKSISLLTKELAKYNIAIDFSEAKIKEIELNTTFNQDFEQLKELLLLIGVSNHRKSVGMYSFKREESKTFITVDRTLYINPKNFIDFTGKSIKIYDKSFQMEREKDLLTDIPLARVEVTLGRAYYKFQVESLGFTNSLKDFLENNFIEILFKTGVSEELILKPTNYLDNIKFNLEKEFLNFRRNEDIKRVERKKLEDKEYIIPDYLKEERGVFRHLKKESWIFDYHFLLEIVFKNIRKNNQEKFIKQILRRYRSFNNLTIFENFIKNIS